jgi:chromosome segregation protein
MLLTSLDIYGFKSFAERTKFVFDSGITGIVGPNGCGKSNVVDSIRWVLGEQKTKNLRSDKMENIIFNGTNAKRKANFAEVSLTFENTKNLLPTEYSTVTITRKLYRSGESEYLINGVTCRLKDIQNLFMDTGISSDSYAIIELGMVDEILTNKDNERRKFFEEAAGIGKYKIRKKQTLKRLADTDADLERVDDLLFEIEKNLKSLEKQARRTQRYFELKESYKQVSSQYAFLMMRDIRGRQQQVKILQDNLEDQFTSVQGELAQREARMQHLRKAQVDDERRLALAQEDLNKHLRKIQSVETEKSIKNERLKYLQQREVSIRNQMENEGLKLERNQAQLKQLREQLARQEQERSEQADREVGLRTEKETLRKRFEEEQRQRDQLAAQHRELEVELQEMSREKELARVKGQSLENELRRAEQDKEQREDEIDAFSEKKEELTASVAALKEQAEALAQRRDLHAAELKTTEKVVAELKDQLYQTNRVIDAKQNEHALTKSLVESLEGFPASVKFLKKQAAWMKESPLLSDVFAVPDAFKVAFENYLESYLSYYVVQSREDAVKAVHLLADASKGRANFFILNDLADFKLEQPLLFTQAQPALDLVEFAPEYKKLAMHLLGHAYVVNSEADIPAEVPEGVVFLTRSGNLSRRRFAMSGGSLGLFEGKRLGRAKNLEKLDRELKELRDRKNKEQRDLEQAQTQLDTLQRTDFTAGLERARQGLNDKQRDLSVLQSREQEYREFILRVGQRADALSQELTQLQEQVIQLDPQIKFKLEEIQQLNSRLAQARGVAEETEEALGLVQTTYNEAHIRLIHLQNQADNSTREIEQKESDIEAFANNTASLQKEMRQVEVDTDQLIHSNSEDDGVIVQLYQQKKDKEGRVGELEQALGQTKNSIRQQEDASAGHRKRREDMQTQQASLKEQATEIRIEWNSLRERMSVEFQVEVDELSQVALFDKALETYDLEALRTELHQTRDKVQNYGEINPMAVQAYNEMKERFDFITGQKADLVEAKVSLLSTIDEIDQSAKEKFLDTYEQVRQHFQRVFRSLFTQDDTCDLVLMDPENPLESEINIIARPKGKRPQTIKQLSGGEKTLTAVALLFSIYLIKPAPFCIFDEVDAPLDDANIDKFNRIIRDFSDGSQFIIVTHNKRTMASTSVIYGVTMMNTGISSVLPVSLSEIGLDEAGEVVVG